MYKDIQDVQNTKYTNVLGFDFVAFYQTIDCIHECTYFTANGRRNCNIPEKIHHESRFQIIV